MAKVWEREAASDVVYKDVTDYKSAMYQLVTQQVLYESDPQQSRAYHLIRRHWTAFENQLQGLGLSLMAPNDAHRYICVRPDEGLRHGQLTKLETQFLIVLRQIYDDRARAADVELDGTARVSIEDFKTAYRGMLGREYTVKITDIRELLRTARRYGMARARDDDEDPEQPLAIEILPALATLLPSTLAGRIGADYRRLESGEPSEDALEEDAGSKEVAE